jgi:hypothetical protein
MLSQAEEKGSVEDIEQQSSLKKKSKLSGSPGELRLSKAEAQSGSGIGTLQPTRRVELLTRLKDKLRETLRQASNQKSATRHSEL